MIVRLIYTLAVLLPLVSLALHFVVVSLPGVLCLLTAVEGFLKTSCWFLLIGYTFVDAFTLFIAWGIFIPIITPQLWLEVG